MLVIMIVTVNRDVDSAQSSRLNAALEVEFLGILIQTLVCITGISKRNM